MQRIRLRTRKVARPTRQNKHLRPRSLSRSSSGSFEGFLYVEVFEGQLVQIRSRSSRHETVFCFRLRHTLEKTYGWSIDPSILRLLIHGNVRNRDLGERLSTQNVEVNERKYSKLKNQIIRIAVETFTKPTDDSEIHDRDWQLKKTRATIKAIKRD